MKKFFQKRRKSKKIKKSNILHLKDPPGSIKSELAAVRHVTSVYQPNKSSLRRYESLNRDISHFGFKNNFFNMKNFYSTNKKKASKACFKRMACDIANEVCNFRPKRRKSHEDVYTSNYNSSDAGESDNYYEKKDFSSKNNKETNMTSDCRETDKSAFKLTRDIEFDSSEYDESVNATELTGESIRGEIVEILSDCRETDELALELINWLEITQALGHYIFYYVEVSPNTLVEEIITNDNLVVKGEMCCKAHELDVNPINNIEEDVKVSSDIINTQKECNNCVDTEQSIKNTDEKTEVSSDCRETDKLTDLLVSSYKMKLESAFNCLKTDKMINKSSNNIRSDNSIKDAVLEALVKLLPDIYEVFSQTINRSRIIPDGSRTNNVYKTNKQISLMTKGRKLIKELKDLTKAIEGLVEDEVTKIVVPTTSNNSAKPNKKLASTKAQKLRELCTGEKSSKGRAVLVRLATKAQLPSYKVVKDVLTDIVGLKPFEYNGVSIEDHGVSLLINSSALEKYYLNPQNVDIAQLLPWSVHELSNQQALAIQIASKVISFPNNNGVLTKGAKQLLKDLESNTQPSELFKYIFAPGPNQGPASS